MIQQHRIIPSHETGYELPKNWYIVTPDPKTNHITNPSFERSLLDWSGYASVQRTGKTSFMGGYSLSMYGDGVTAADDVKLNSSVVISESGIYTASVYVLYPFGNGGGNFEAKMSIWQPTEATIINSSKAATSTTWQRLSVSANLTAGVAGVSLHLGTNDEARIIYFDGVQLESGGVASTYFDGDSIGFGGNDSKKYFWLGVPHESESQRLQTKSGGLIENFSKYGLQITNYLGANFTSFDSTSTSLALQPGALYQRTVADVRNFSLIGTVCGSDLSSIQCNLFGIEGMIKPNVATSAGLVRMLYQDCSCSGRLLEIDAVYQDGLEGRVNGLYQQSVSLSFTAYNPFFKRLRERGQSVNTSALVATENMAIRDVTGGWIAPNGSPNGEVKKLQYIGDKLVVLGSFTDAGSTTLNQFGIYEDGVWGAAIDFIAETPTDFTIAPDGTFYILEQNALGDSELSSWREGDVSRTSVKIWTDSGSFTVVESDSRGNLYVGGNKGRIERYVASSWDILIENITGTVFDIDIDRNGFISFAGSFSSTIGKTVAAVTEPGSLFCEPNPDLTPIEPDVQIRVVGTDLTLVNATVDTENLDDSDPIVSYLWSNDANANTATTVDIIGFDLDWLVLQAFVVLTMQATTASGKVFEQSVTYLYVDEDGDRTLQLWRDSDNTYIYNLIDSVPFSASCCIETDENSNCDDSTITKTSGESSLDPIASWDWSNDANVNTYSGQDVTMDLTGAPIGGQVVVTLTTTTEAEIINVNTITLDYSTDRLLTENSRTNDITGYTVIISDGAILPFYNFMTLRGGLWDGLTDATICYSVKSINDDLYIGTGQGLSLFEASTLRALGSQVGAIRDVTADENNNIITLGQSGVHRWDGYTLRDLGIKFSIGIKTNSVTVGANNLIAIGYESQKALRSSGYSSIFYSGSVEAKPRAVIRGPGTLREITNISTRQSLIFNYAMGEGEYININLEGVPSATSSYLQNIEFEAGTQTEMFLQEGDNDIVCFVEGGGGNTEASIITRPTHHGINALCCADDTDEKSDILDIPQAPCCGYSFIVSDVDPGCYDGVEVGSRWYNPFTGAFIIRTN